jgi:hypothetical protein
MSLRFSPIAIPDAATYTVKEYNSGLLHVFPNLTADTVVTLPSPKKGLKYEFWYGGAAADAQDWLLDTGSNTYFFKGGVVHIDSNADAAGDEVVPVYADGNSNSKMTVLTPDAGTTVTIICDGTNWYVNGSVVSATAPSFADQ